MSMIEFPAVGLRNLRLKLRQPAQVNRSGWTGRRQVVGLPGGALWSASGEFIPRIGQENSYVLRSFVAALRGPFNTFALPVYEAEQTPDFPTLESDPIYPVASVSCSVSITSTGSNFLTSGGSGGWGSSSSRSTTATTSGCALSFRAGQTNREWFVGINADPASGDSYTTLDHAFYGNSSSGLQIWENGSGVVTAGSYTTTDVLSIVYDNSTIKYYRNGDLLRSVATTSGRTLYFDSAFNASGTVINDIRFQALPSVSAGVRTVNVQGLVSGNIVKAGWLATFLVKGGGSQMVMIVKDATANGSGIAAIDFEPPLRDDCYAVILDRPFFEAALTSDEVDWSVSPGQMYGFAFEAEESVA